MREHEDVELALARDAPIEVERNLDDPERRERLGKAGRVRAQELFSWAAVAKTTAEAYERVLADYADNPTSTHKRVKRIKVSTSSTTDRN